MGGGERLIPSQVLPGGLPMVSLTTDTIWQLLSTSLAKNMTSS